MTETEDVTETDGGTEMIGAALTLDGTWTADVTSTLAETWMTGVTSTLDRTWTADAADKRWVKHLLLRPKMTCGLKPRTSLNKEDEFQKTRYSLSKVEKIYAIGTIYCLSLFYCPM